MTNLSVVMISPNFYPYVIGGAEKQALELSCALQALGVKVQVLTRRVRGLPSKETIQGVPVKRLWTSAIENDIRGQLYLRLVRKCGGGLLDSVFFMISIFLWLLIHRAQYQAIHVHLGGSPALAASFAGKLLGKRVVVKLGGGKGIGEIAVSSRTWAGRLKLGLLARLKPQFVAVTQELVGELQEHRLASVPVTVLPNGVDVQRYHPASSEEKVRARQDLGLPAAGLCLLYAGRMSWEKQLDVFVQIFWEALRQLDHEQGTFFSSRSPIDRPTGSGETFLVLLGEGAEEIKVRQVVRDRQMEKHVFFSPPTPDIQRFYAAADVFVLPSISEGLSNALLEAMASGLGVLASRVGGLKDAIQDGENGLLFDPRLQGEMQSRLMRFLKDPELAARLGRQARETVTARYDLTTVARHYLEIYEPKG